MESACEGACESRGPTLKPAHEPMGLSSVMPHMCRISTPYSPWKACMHTALLLLWSVLYVSACIKSDVYASCKVLLRWMNKQGHNVSVESAQWPILQHSTKSAPAAWVWALLDRPLSRSALQFDDHLNRQGNMLQNAHAARGHSHEAL